MITNVLPPFYGSQCICLWLCMLRGVEEVGKNKGGGRGRDEREGEGREEQTGTQLATSRTTNLVQVMSSHALPPVHHTGQAPQYLSNCFSAIYSSGNRYRLRSSDTLTMSCREHAPSLANVVSSTLVLLSGTVCLLICMTLQTQIHSRSGLKLFCLIVHIDLLLLLYTVLLDGSYSGTLQIAHYIVLYCIVRGGEEYC